MHHAAASVQLAPDSWPTDEPSPNVYLFIVQKYTLQRRPYPLNNKKNLKMYNKRKVYPQFSQT